MCYILSLIVIKFLDFNICGTILYENVNDVKFTILCITAIYFIKISFVKN